MSGVSAEDEPILNCETSIGLETSSHASGHVVAGSKTGARLRTLVSLSPQVRQAATGQSNPSIAHPPRPSQFIRSSRMSDAPAAPAPVTDNGVPAATQEKIVEEVPGHKVHHCSHLTVIS
jgi:hypothetical protein